VFNMEAGLHLLWPTGKERKQPIEDLKQHLVAARLYDATRTAEADATKNGQVQPGTPTLVDPRYEALRPYLRGERAVYVEAETKQEILEVLHFAQQEKLKVVLCGAIDAWKVADQIKAAGVSVIVGPVMRKPQEEYDPFDAPYANAGRLQEAGVKFCFRSDTASNSRNVPFEAAMSVAYGLPEQVALRGVTLTSAEILGVADRMGSLTAGKWANAVITDGSPLQETTQIKGILIQGQPFAPESRQTKFYDKYRARLKK
ncbi:MAG TPA: amidohydrolase family protein, partial [Schlesneria sp.]